MIVTRSRQDHAGVLSMVTAILDNLDNLRRLHPAFADFQLNEMVRPDAIAPYHPAALRYYCENGYLSDGCPSAR